MTMWQPTPASMLAPAAIVGEAEAGHAAKVKAQINKIIKGMNASNIDLAELLYEAKSKKMYTDWGFDTWKEYVESIDLKPGKAFYLTQIIKTMNNAGIPREIYEPLGTAKLVALSRLEGKEEYQGKPMTEVIKGLIISSDNLTYSEMNAKVDEILGQTGDEAFEFITLKVKKLAKENVIKPAMELVRQHMGTPTKDDDGKAVEYSDGAVIEMICANILADPNYAQKN